MTYELKLPKDWKIYNVFHVELLRSYVYDVNHILLDLLKAALKEDFLAESEKFLKIEHQHLRNKTFHRVYVKLIDYPEEEKFFGKDKLILEGTIQILSLKAMIFDGRERL